MQGKVRIRFVQQGLAFYNAIDVPAQLVPPSEEAPYSALVIRLDEIGSNDTAVNVEIGFIPGLGDASQKVVYLLQINATLPIGAFGMFLNGGALYYKYNAMLHRSWLTGEKPAVRLDQQNGLILHQLHLYIDQLL